MYKCKHAIKDWKFYVIQVFNLYKMYIIKGSGRIIFILLLRNVVLNEFQIVFKLYLSYRYINMLKTKIYFSSVIGVTSQSH